MPSRERMRTPIGWAWPDIATSPDPSSHSVWRCAYAVHPGLVPALTSLQEPRCPAAWQRPAWAVARCPAAALLAVTEGESRRPLFEPSQSLRPNPFRLPDHWCG